VEELEDGSNPKETLEFFGLCNILIHVRGEIKGDIIDIQQHKQSPFQLKENQTKGAVGAVQEVAHIDKIVRENQRTGRDSPRKGEKVEADSATSHQQTFVPSPGFTRKFGLSPDAEYKLAKIFSFDHERKRMSVLVHRPASADGQRPADRIIFCKGAPESVIKLCKDSTVPSDFQQKALDLTLKGYRILAFGYRILADDEEVKWAEEAESGLTFLGLLLMQNLVKPKTEETIATLIRCNVEVLMITGDNVYTGINAALASGMVNAQQKIYVCQLVGGNNLKWFVLSKEELLKSLTFINSTREAQGALLEKSLEKSVSRVSGGSREKRQTGSGRHMTTVDKGITEILNDCEENDCVLAIEADAYDFMVRKFNNSPATRDRILKYTRVYGRTKPIQKQRVIRDLKELNFKRNITVGFVGDGSNDSIAFKEANMGLCVGSKDAAITASFSSAVTDISAVIPVLCLGRFTIECMLQVMKIALFNGVISSLVITVINAYGLSFTNFDLLNDRFQFLGLYICTCLTMHRDQLNGFLPKAGFVNLSMIAETLTAIALGVLFVFLSFTLLVTRIENKRPDEIVPTLKGINFEDHFFVESKYMLVMFSLLDLCVSYAFHRALPFKQAFHTNLVLMSAFAIYAFIHSLPFFVHSIGSHAFLRAWNRFRAFPSTDDDLKYKALSFTAVYSVIIVIAIKMVQESQLRAGLKSQAKKRSKWTTEIQFAD
jgi:magnesium-transporting ATPase (P-type)